MAINNTQAPSVKKYVDYANQQVDEQAILDKYNAATLAQFNVQREQNRQAENQFYNQMYNTQKTAMDTIRQSNAAAVSTGASRGVQAANELSSLLGLQSESIASATELAQANRQTAQEETAAVLENVLNAYQQAQQERANLLSSAIEAESVEVQREANQVQAASAAAQNQTDQARLLTEAAENGTNTYLTALTQSGKNYKDGVVTPESQQSLEVALSNIGKTKDGESIKFTGDDWKGSSTGTTKATEITNTINNICDAYGLNKGAYKEQLDDLQNLAKQSSVSWAGYGGDTNNLLAEMEEKYGGDRNAWDSFWSAKSYYAEQVQKIYQNLITRIRNDYASGANRKSNNNN